MASGVTILPVKAPGGGYDVLLGEGLLGQLPQLLKDRGLATRTVVVTNDTLAPLYGASLVDVLPDAFLVAVPDGEQHKSLETLSTVFNEMIASRLGRDGLVVALGGGVICDMAGLAAATYMRGVKLVQVPTSLLAMVDASVGGKVAVDLPAGKNLVGAFKQPELVVIDADVLNTLPVAEHRAGLAEVVKAGLIADPALLDALEGDWSHLDVIRRALEVKIALVEADPYEDHVRARLNLGHTFAHAIEVCANYGTRHGEAVAVGLVAALRLSARLGLTNHSLGERIETLLTRLALPTRHGIDSVEDLWDAMSRDKKARAGRRRFVLVGGIGQVDVVPDVRREEVLAVLEELRGKMVDRGSSANVPSTWSSGIDGDGV